MHAKPWMALCLSQSGSALFTSDREGGYICAIREQVIQSAKDAGFKPVVKERISPDELLQAEELFLLIPVTVFRKYSTLKTGDTSALRRN